MLGAGAPVARPETGFKSNGMGRVAFVSAPKGRVHEARQPSED